MARAWGAVGFILWGCSGETAERVPPEVCDDEIDNDGDGLVDCDDDNCGGLPCQQKGQTETGDTDEPDALEILLNDDCCDFSFAADDCPQMLIGSVTFINRDPEEAGSFDVSCDTVNNDPVIEWKVVGGANQSPFLVNLPLAADSSVTVEAYYVCSPGLTQSFNTICHLHAELENRKVDLDHPVRATRVGP